MIGAGSASPPNGPPPRIARCWEVALLLCVAANIPIGPLRIAARMDRDSLNHGLLVRRWLGQQKIHDSPGVMLTLLPPSLTNVMKIRKRPFRRIDGVVVLGTVISKSISGDGYIGADPRDRVDAPS